MEGNIQTVLDTRGALRCVRFDSGNVGVVTTKGNTKLVVGPFQQLSFAENGFLRVFNRKSSERRDPSSLGLSRVENEEGEANRRTSERRAEGLARRPEGESQLVRAIPREEEEADRQPRMSIDRRIYPIITLMYRCAGLLCSFFFCFLIVDLLGSTFENRDITMSSSPTSFRPR